MSEITKRKPEDFPHQRGSNLLKEAVEKPGTVSKCYSTFWNFSWMNSISAMIQLKQMELPIEPIACGSAWEKMGRKVKPEERSKKRGIWLCMPRSYKKKVKDTETGEEREETFWSSFVWRPNWYSLSQTEGEEYKTPALPEWDYNKALKNLAIKEIPYADINGNCQGYASKDGIAINPIAQHKWKTIFHELAHHLLGHIAENPLVALTDGELTPRSLKEAEAESVALICGEALGLDGSEESRGYIQGWYGKGNQIPEKSAHKILSVATKILKAGREVTL